MSCWTRIPSAGFNNAIPGVVVGKIVTCTWPCIRFSAGKADWNIFWQHESSYGELVMTADEKEKFAADGREVEAFDQWRKMIGKELAAVS